MKTILSHPNFDELSKKIVQNHPDKLSLGKISMQNFADGWPNIFIDDVKEKIEHQEVTYI